MAKLEKWKEALIARTKEPYCYKSCSRVIEPFCEGELYLILVPSNLDNIRIAINPRTSRNCEKDIRNYFHDLAESKRLRFSKESKESSGYRKVRDNFYGAASVLTLSAGGNDKLETRESNIETLIDTILTLPKLPKSYPRSIKSGRIIYPLEKVKNKWKRIRKKESERKNVDLSQLCNAYRELNRSSDAIMGYFFSDYYD